MTFTDCDENKDDINGDDFSAQLDSTLAGLIRQQAMLILLKWLKNEHLVCRLLPAKNAYRKRTDRQA